MRRVLDQAEAPSPVRLSKQTLEMPLGGTCEAFKVQGVQNQKTMVVSVRFGSVSVSSIWYRPGSVPVRFRFLRFLVDFGSVRFGVWNILH